MCIKINAEYIAEIINKNKLVCSSDVELLRYDVLEIYRLLNLFYKMDNKINDMGAFNRRFYCIDKDKTVGDDKTPYNEHHYPYIQFSPEKFIDLILEIKKYGLRNYTVFYEMNFIDVGSGVGDKVLLSRLGEFKSSLGIEYSKKTFDISTEYLKDIPGINLFNGNAFDFDFSLLKSFIYMYRPMSDDLMMEKLYRKIIKEMKKGSILMEMLGNCFTDTVAKLAKEKKIKVCLGIFSKFSPERMWIRKRSGNTIEVSIEMAEELSSYYNFGVIEFRPS